MDFSRLHMYTPPQCVPENTGYTYALSSSYSSDALDFETEHKLDPVFDSPRMSRRSLRLVTTAYTTDGGQAGDIRSCDSSMASLKDRAARAAKQRRGAGKPASGMNHASRKVAAGPPGTAGLRPPVLDASLIREQTRVDHFWGLDDDGDLKGGSKAVTQGNGDVAAEAARSNGYTCSDCSLLAERRSALTAGAASQGTVSRIYSRDRNQRPWPGDGGRTAAKGFPGEDGRLGADGEASSEDYQGKQRLETHTASRWPSAGPRSVAGTAGHAFSHAGRFLMQMLQRTRAAGWCVSEMVLSALWSAVTAPGKAASGIFWWLGSGWYQFVTLISWLNVFLLTRCLRNICKFLLLLIPLLLLLGAGLSLWGQGGPLSFLPVVNWTHVYRAQRADGPESSFSPASPHPSPPLEGGDETVGWRRMGEVERWMASLSGQCQSHDERLRDLAASLQKLQLRVDQMDDGREGVSSLVRQAVSQRLKEMSADGLLGPKADLMTSHQDHAARIASLEAVLGKLTEKSEVIQKELEETKLRTTSGLEEEQRLLSVVKQLELELSHLRSELSQGQHLTPSCEKVDAIHEKVDARVRETLGLLVSDGQWAGELEGLLQKLSPHFVSKDDLQVSLRDLELRILKEVTHHVSVTKQTPTSETIMSAVNEAGISGITEAQAHVIVNNALKLYSQDKTGMVDFALESGGGSVLSTRCSETYETKTALVSLFGVPLWYFSQSPRVVIQPDMYPGNCWAFRGSQGYLVVRLSMKIHPTGFALEHIPKALSPTGNISSAPKDFAVYGLENEYEEEGELLGQFVYDQEGESLQVFRAPKRPERAFQIVELRVLSNWGHPEYTCLYRFRVHGEPIK
ncbi:SUN domain-containing protein 1 isoform X3 [Rousettus aegyptiacus]|uniref:SUN domain-containing protein 1 isoform X3 n=1 Tax=Rousettus aegyptiacus TaxID=9407 RepID=UPI00168CD672|nr:SUN domain-containing protein 1 isoform X3 [Rousettus aegyptiacus]